MIGIKRLFFRSRNNVIVKEIKTDFRNLNKSFKTLVKFCKNAKKRGIDHNFVHEFNNIYKVNEILINNINIKIEMNKNNLKINDLIKFKFKLNNYKEKIEFIKNMFNETSKLEEQAINNVLKKTNKNTKISKSKNKTKVNEK